MIFSRNYNVILRLMCEVSPEFKTKYANFIKEIPEDIRTMCKKGHSFSSDKYEMYDDQSYVRFTANQNEDNYAMLIVTETMPHSISWLDKGERILVGELDTGNDNFQCFIEKVDRSKYMVIINRELNDNDYMRISDYTYEELASKLDTKPKLTSTK